MKHDYKTSLAMLLAYIDAGQPAIMIGSPGCGKSSLARQIAEMRGKVFHDTRWSMMDALDARGTIAVRDGMTVICPPAYFPRSGGDEANPNGTVWLHDEINCAQEDVLVALYQLMLDRRSGDYVVPDDCDMICAGNRLSDRGAAKRMPSALTDRVAIIDFQPSLADFVRWANRTGIHPALVSFLRHNPTLLNQFDDPNFDPRKLADTDQFATQRSWAACSPYIDLTKSIRLPLIASLVGERNACELETHLRTIENCPSFDEIQADPKSCRLPRNVGESWAVSSMIARLVDVISIEQIAPYLKRMDREFTVYTIVDAVQRDPALMQTQCVTDWATSNPKVRAAITNQ